MSTQRVRVADLTPEQLAKLQARLQGAGASRRAPAPAAVPRDRPLPLSFAQQRLWFIDQLQPGNPAYNVPVAYRVRGALDPARLERALDALVRRHESLRTVFPARGGEPAQVILPTVPVPAVTDLRGMPAGPRGDAVRRLAAEETLRPFDLAAGPLLRAGVLRTDAAEWVILFTMHHVVSDAWSMRVLFREVSELYGALETGRAPALAPLPLQYADYAVWQRGCLAGGVLDAQLAWWRQRLAGAPPLLELPADRPRPQETDVRGGQVFLALPEGAARALRALAHEEGATLFMALLAAWQSLLGRYTGSDDVSVGTPVAGRPRTELEGLIGYFSNTLVLRTDLSGGPSFRALLRRVRETTLAAFDRQDVPFERLVEELAPARSMAHTPLFQVLFHFRTSGRGEDLLGSLPAEALVVEGEAAQFDLSLGPVEAGDALHVELSYRADLFDRGTAERMAAHFSALAQAAAAAPDRPAAGLPFLGAAERHQVLTGWNATAAEYPAERCVHDLVADVAARMPDAPAVVFAGGSLSYGELDARANRLARHLRRRGVGPDERVGICLERGPEMMVAVLGILKAGAAYVPVDSAYPADRITYILKDSAAPVLVTQRSLVAALPSTGAQVVRVDADADVIAAESGDPIASGALPDGLAYVIYTSGSTGRPKGVAMTHRPLANLLAWQEREWKQPAASATLQFTSLSFDVSFQEVFSCWTSGGRLVLLSDDERRDLPAVLHRLDGDGIERLFLPYVALQHLAQLADEHGPIPARLREVRTAGEQLRITEPIRRLFGATGATLGNQYGPSETHVATAHVLDGDPAGWPLLPPIGAPIANTRCYVLDGAGEPAPVGVPGELFLAGVPLARGYLGRPALTAERFVPDPFGEPGARAYRTGDRVRRRAGGTLEFLGRTDDQVKVRGFRIEPGEVEAALEAHPAVREAVVVVREDEAGDRRLAGYVVPAPGAAPSAAELRAHLGERLPEYMIPSAVVVLDAFPLTPSGKVARRALPAPGVPTDADAYVAPRTPAEELVAGIFAEVLGRTRMGAHDDFFTLGGHSLLATRVVSRVRAAFGVELPVRGLFEAPTVSALAARIADLRPDGSAGQAPPLVPVPRDVPLPLSFAQQRLWFIHQLEPGNAAYNLPFALRLRGALDVDALERGLTEIVRRHEALRTRFVSDGGEPVQVIDPPRPVSLPVIDLTGEAEDGREADLRQLASDEALRPFDLAAGPLLRSTLVRMGDDEHVMLFTMHHAVSDGWSMSVLVREISELYGAFSEGREPSLPALPVQYADFAVWQRAWLSGEVLDAHLDWWRASLAGAPPLLELPTDRPPPLVASERGASVPFALPADVAEALQALSRREGATLFMTLMAAWQLLLSRYSGQDDVSVGSPVAGRTRLETEGLIGFFVNTLVIRTDLSGQPSFRALLGRVRETALGAYQHQDIPFEKLVEELAPERSMSHTPLFQAMLILQNNARDALRLGSVEAEAIVPADAPAQFDLTLTLGEVEGGIQGTLSYRAELFDAGTAERMMAHFRALLEGVLAAPDAPVGRVPFLGADERRQVVQAWNATERPYPLDVPVHALVAAQARRTPDAVAVSFGEERLTYAALDARANQLAHHLRGMGVRADARVAVCLERSAEMVVGLLGVLKAGAAYVPIDPAYPADRIAYMLADAGADVVLTEARLADGLPEHGARVVRVDADGARIAFEPSHAPAVAVSPEHLAYVIYTSGSTGRPKGVMVRHGGVSSFLQTMAEAPGLASGDTLLALTTIAFDISVLELFLPLTLGARVAVASREAAADPQLLAALVAESGATVMQATPATWAMLLASGWAPRPGMRLLTGGEALPRAVADPLLAAGAELWNMYGPTETTIWSSTVRVPAEGLIPLGGAIANTTLYVLDEGMDPAPLGVSGELFIGGAGVARGYLGRPALTAERFVPDPFGAPGSRLYRTGDRVRRRADGALEFGGRMDFQVKLRGFRIELGEIEAALGRHPAVHEAAALVREDRPGDPRLVAYVTTAEGADAPGAAELRAHLTAGLPAYMVPSAFVVLEALPRTPNGKIDRKALPAPVDASADSERYVEPRTPAEEMLAGIFADVLKVERVGADADFFALGGHSLLATQLATRARAAFGTELPLRVVFQQPTVAGLAAWLDGRRAGAGRDDLPIEHVARPGAWLPLSFAQQRLWVVHQLDPENRIYNQGFGLRLVGQLDVGALRRVVTELVRRHAVFRTRFVERDDVPGQVIDPPRPVPLPMVDLSGVASDPSVLNEIAREHVRQHFDLGAGDQLRVLLVRLAADEHAVFTAMHHITSDGWSMGIMNQEMAVLYHAFAQGRPSPLPDPPIHYADYAVWQRAWLTPEREREQLEFWRGQLEGLPALHLATDRARVSDGTDGESYAFPLSPELSEGVRRLSRSLGATPFMTLLAAFKTLLHWQGQGDEVVVGTDIANRNLRAETERVVGFFVNQLVLRTTLGENPEFRTLVARVREVTLAAYDHQDLPFDRIVGALQPRRAAGETPFFRVKFMLQNAPASEAAALPGLVMEPLPPPRSAAQMDVLLSMDDVGDHLVGGWEYRTSLFSRELIERWTRRFQSVLEAAVADPAIRLHEIEARLAAEDRREAKDAQAALLERRRSRFARK
jgi:amino acid adenylation domain-containing protein